MALNFFEMHNLNDIALIYLLNEKNLSAQTWSFYVQLIDLIDSIETDSNIKIAIFAGKKEHFSAGLDISDFFKNHQSTIAKKDNVELYKIIKTMQKGMQMMFNGKKIYIAAINGYCIGGGLDFISACDLRFCEKKAIFSLRETKLGITADLGSLQRLPYIIGFNNAKLLAYLSNDIDANFAKQINLVSEVFADKEELISETIKIATNISKNPFSAVSNSKKFINNLIYDKINEELDKVAKFNAKYLDFNNIIDNLPKTFKKEK